MKKYQKRTNHSKVNSNNKNVSKVGTSPSVDNIGTSSQGEKPETIPNGDISKPVQRPRTDSKDSEKENRPSSNSVNEIIKTDNAINKKSPALPRRNVESRYKGSKDLKDLNNKSSTTRTKPQSRKTTGKVPDVSKNAGKVAKQSDNKEDINAKSANNSQTDLVGEKNDNKEKANKPVIADTGKGKQIEVKKTEQVEELDNDEDKSVKEIEDVSKIDEYVYFILNVVLIL